MEAYNLFSSISIKFEPGALNIHSSSIGIVPVPSSVEKFTTAVSLVCITEQSSLICANIINVHVTIVSNECSIETQINTNCKSVRYLIVALGIILNYPYSISIYYHCDLRILNDKRLSSSSSTSTSRPGKRFPTSP